MANGFPAQAHIGWSADRLWASQVVRVLDCYVWGEWRKLHNKEHHGDQMKKETDGACDVYGEEQRCIEFWYKNLWTRAI